MEIIDLLVFFYRNENHFLANFKSNIRDPQKYLFRPKCRLPTQVSESKESKEVYSISRVKIDFENWKKKVLLKFFTFQSKINHVWVKQKYFLNFFPRQSWLVDKMKKIFFCKLNLFGKYFGLKLAKKILKLIFFIKFFNNKYLCWKHKIHQ